MWKWSEMQHKEIKKYDREFYRDGEWIQKTQHIFNQSSKEEIKYNGREAIFEVIPGGFSRNEERYVFSEWRTTPSPQKGYIKGSPCPDTS